MRNESAFSRTYANQIMHNSSFKKNWSSILGSKLLQANW